MGSYRPYSIPILDRQCLEERRLRLLGPPIRTPEDDEIVVRETLAAVSAADPKIRVIAIALYGSRWFQNAVFDSDWDVACITEGYDQPEQQLNKNVIILNLDYPNVKRIDVALLEASYFEWLHRNSVIWAIGISQQSPTLDANLLWGSFGGRHLKVRYLSIKKAMPHFYATYAHQARSFWRSGQIRKSKKRIVLIVRFLRFTLELCQQGYVTSPAVGNDFNDVFMYLSFSSWAEFEHYWSPIATEAFQEVLRYIDPKIGLYTEFEHEHGHPFAASRAYLAAVPLADCDRYLSLGVELRAGLLVATSEPEETPTSSLIGRECAPLVLAADTREVVACSHLRFEPLTKAPAEPDWTGVLPEGRELLLFHHPALAKWLVIPTQRTDAPEVEKLSEQFWAAWAAQGLAPLSERLTDYAFIVFHSTDQNSFFPCGLVFLCARSRLAPHPEQLMADFVAVHGLNWPHCPASPLPRATVFVQRTGQPHWDWAQLPNPHYTLVEQLRDCKEPASSALVARLMLDFVIELEAAGRLAAFPAFPLPAMAPLFADYRGTYQSLIASLEAFLVDTVGLGTGSKEVLPYLEKFPVDPQLLLLVRKSRLGPALTFAAWRKKKLVRKMLFEIFGIKRDLE